MAHYGSLTKTRPGRQWWSKWPSEQRNRGEKLKEKITKRHICVLCEDGGKKICRRKGAGLEKRMEDDKTLNVKDEILRI